MAWSLVQKQATQATNGAGSLPANSTAGNLLVATVTNGSATALTPPAGWTTVQNVVNGTVNECYIFAYFNTVGGQSSFAFTGGSGAIHCCVAEFTCSGVSGVSGASAVGTNTAGKVATLNVQSGSGALASDLVIVAAMEHTGTASTLTWTDPSGFNEMAGALSLASSTNHGYGAFDTSAASSGIQTVAITCSLTSTSTSGWTAVIATFSLPAVNVQGPSYIISQYGGFF